MPQGAGGVTGIVSDAQIAAVARQAGWSGTNLQIAVAVALAESSGRADAVNYLGCTGLWQVYVRVHIKDHPLWTTAWLKNPANNAVAAFAIWKSQGWSRGWTTYHSGAYKKYMSRAAKVVGGAIAGPISGSIAEGAFSPDGGVAPTFDFLTNPQNYKRLLLILVGILCVGIAAWLQTLPARVEVAKTALTVLPGGGAVSTGLRAASRASTAKGLGKAIKGTTKAVKAAG